MINARFAKPLDRELILDRGAWQAARRDVRGERRERRVRVGRARGDRGGAPRRRRAARRPGADHRDPRRAVRRPRLGRGSPPAPPDSTRRASRPRSARRSPSSGRPRRCAHRRPRSRSPPDPATPRQPRTRRVWGAASSRSVSVHTTTPNSSTRSGPTSVTAQISTPRPSASTDGSERPTDPEASPGADPTQRRGQPVERDHDHDHVAEGHVRCRCHGRECHDQRQPDDEPAQADDHVQDRRSGQRDRLIHGGVPPGEVIRGEAGCATIRG